MKLQCSMCKRIKHNAKYEDEGSNCFWSTGCWGHMKPVKEDWYCWYFAGPYVPSGVIYGKIGSPSFSVWLVPGFDPDPPIHKIDLYGKILGG